jgi:type II secretory pathway predicted ATPase ExeA
MINEYRAFFGFSREPFSKDVNIGEILETPSLSATVKRFEYAVQLGAVGIVTGDIGSGKTTAVRYAAEKLHPSEYKTLYVTAGHGSILELYRTIVSHIAVDASSNSRASMVGTIKAQVAEWYGSKKIRTVLIVDEASLLRLEVFSELHILGQFEKDSKPWLSIVLVGQSSLVDLLQYPGALPFSSRVVSRSHLKGVDRDQLERYLRHRLSIAGVDAMVFDETAVTAIMQGSAGLYRKANLLARGALIAAAHRKSESVSADHVRLAASEIF